MYKRRDIAAVQGERLLAVPPQAIAPYEAAKFDVLRAVRAIDQCNFYSRVGTAVRNHLHGLSQSFALFAFCESGRQNE